MKILLVHNHYGSAAPSGENRVFELERALLESRGHEVRTFERHSDHLRARGAWGKISGALTTPWNPAAAREMRRVVQDYAPDVVHAHNTFPMLSPSVFPAAAPAARVLTLHNYRLLCPAAIPMRDGEVCTDCIAGKTVLPALKHGCYRDSKVATLPLALNVALNRARGTWRRDVDAFIALTDFQRDLMSEGGLPRDRVHVKPNFFPGQPKRRPYDGRPDHVVFAGRLSAEKGIDDLITAWLQWGPEAPHLRIVGDGPLRAALEARAGHMPNITFLGQISSDEAETEIGQARLLVLPSRWFEGFPMVLREAFALGTPVAVSDIGPLPGLAQAAGGAVFRGGDPDSLHQTVQALWTAPGQLEQAAQDAVRAFETRYSEQVNYEQLMQIYRQASETAAQSARSH